VRPAILLFVAVIVAACGNDDGPAPDSGAPDLGADAGVVDAFVPPLLDPGLFDCTASTPARTSTRPLHCALDAECTDRLVSAHRGAGAPSELAPEDSLSAFRAAIAAGADLTELDVHVTADDEVVVIHDDTVDRTTSGSGEVAAMTLAELQALPLRAEDFVGDFGCERVPTLAEVLALTRGKITVVIDGTKTDRMDLVVAVVQAAGAVDEVILDADTERVMAALALEPALPFFVRATSVDELSVLDAVEGASPRYVHIEGATDDDALIAAVQAADQRVFGLAFGVDITVALGGDPAGYDALWERGVQMLQTNRPEVVAPRLE